MSSTVVRKLAAIMFTDIAGYTAQMSKDENKALEMLRKKRSIIRPLIDNHKGIYVKEIGDGTLSYFESGYNASACAKELQKKLHDEELNIKVGIHIGDIVFDDEDVYGDGVNIASRIESLAPAGGVLISKNVYDELINKDDFDGIALGLQSLKGVGRLVELYAIKDKYLAVPNLEDYKNTEIEVHKDDEVPSIAIIPFSNKGADEDAFYSYGISVDLISDVSGAGLIRVASKKQIDEAGELPQEELAKKLDVRYMANGELWRMGDMFQLSVELYDTKDNKVVWSDRWQEKWDNLPNIKSSLSDGLLKALDTKPKVEQKAETTNTKAYELYLKASHTYAKRIDTNDTEVARELLHQAIELDYNLMSAKVQLGTTYMEMGDYNEAMGIYTSTLKQAEKLGDKVGIGNSINHIGIVHYMKGDYDKALDYYTRSLKICDEIGDKQAAGLPLGNIGTIHAMRGEYDKALDCFGRVQTIQEEIVNRFGMGQILNNIGVVHYYKGEYDKALEYQNRSLKIREEVGDKYGMSGNLNNIGLLHYNRGDYNKAEEYLEKSLPIQKEIGFKEIELETTTYLYLSYAHLCKDYDEKDIHNLIKEAKNIEFELNFRLYQLLDDTIYLETAYKQVLDTASEMEEEIGVTFLSNPITTEIKEEYEKVQ